MGLIERQFRSRFTPAEHGYIYQVDHVDYWFDAEQVDAFARDLRWHWHPLVLIGYLLAGVALPAFLYFQGHTGAAFVIGTIGAIVMAVNLIYPLRQPAEATLNMLGHANPPARRAVTGFQALTAIGFAALFALAAWGFQNPDKPWFEQNLFLVYFACYMAASAVVDVVLWLQGRRGAEPLTDKAKHKLRNRSMYLVLPILCVAVQLSPGSDGWDLAFPLFMLALLVALDIADYWLQRSRREEAVV